MNGDSYFILYLFCYEAVLGVKGNGLIAELATSFIIRFLNLYTVGRSKKASFYPRVLSWTKRGCST